MADQTENPAPPAVADPWADVFPLTCLVTLDLPIPKFRIRDLLQLSEGSVVEAHWKEGTHLPFQANGRHLGWVDFEVIGDRLAIQVTELI
jgi:flagellar motor switch/type III secretory pathway protein FliN